MLSMQNHPTAMPSPSSVLDSGSRLGVGPFRLTSPAAASLRLSALNNNNNNWKDIAVESPSSSDDSQSHVASVSTDDAPEDLAGGWPQELHELSPAKGIVRMRRESEPNAASSATSTTFSFTLLTSSDSMDTASPEPLIPKIEELDDDGEGLLAFKAGEDNPADGTSMALVCVPRKRGRPRKHPLPTPGDQAKVAKGRSKTGCITCRRRKKKCDETKPACKWMQ
jgi:hypothetical protein